MKALVKFTKLVEEAQIPEYAHGPEEDAGMDLVAVEDATIGIGQVKSISCGLSMELQPGFEGQVRSRSGLALKHGVIVANAPGTIDPSYRGEIRVLLVKIAGPEPYQVRKGDRIAQLVISPYATATARLARRLSKSKRGSGGFGSTGK